MKQNLSLLLVDDDPDDVEMVIETLAELSPKIQVSTAGNGEEALDFLSRNERALPDMILLDLRMPRLDGKRCLTEIRKKESSRKIPVIVFTTSRDVQESMALKELGADHFITKPANPEDIYYMLSLVIEEQWKELSDFHQR